MSGCLQAADDAFQRIKRKSSSLIKIANEKRIRMSLESKFRILEIHKILSRVPPLQSKKTFTLNWCAAKATALQLKGMAVEIEVGSVPSCIVDSTLNLNVPYHR